MQRIVDSPRCFSHQIHALIDVLLTFRMRLLRGLGRDMIIYHYLDHAVQLLILDDTIIPICPHCRIILGGLVHAMEAALRM
jgi:hypothetical protein